MRKVLLAMTILALSLSPLLYSCLGDDPTITEEEQVELQKKDTTTETNTSTNTEQKPGPKTTITTENLLQCPTSESNEYAYFDFFTREKVTFLPDSRRIAEGTISTEPGFVDFEYAGAKWSMDNDIITISQGRMSSPSDIHCGYFREQKRKVTEVFADDSLSTQAVVFRSGGKMIVASNIKGILSSGSCDGHFKSFTATNAVKFIQLSRSQDFTVKKIKETIELPKGLDISLNAPPPDSAVVKTTEEVPAYSDYIYFITNGGWIGRVKPAMAGGGCVEHLWHSADAPRDPKQMTIDDDKLTIEFDHFRKVEINLK